MSKLWLPILSLFWGVMMILLIRAEFGGGLQSSLPVETVISRILRAPDDSQLVLYKHGVRLGTMRWVPNVGRAIEMGKISTDLPPPTADSEPDFRPEGIVETISDFTLDLDGNLYLIEDEAPIRFDMRLVLAPDLSWKEYSVRVNSRPYRWERRTAAATRVITIGQRSLDDPWEKKFTFEQLRQPEKILSELGFGWMSTMVMPLLGGFSSLVPPPAPAPSDGASEPMLASVASVSGIEWEATLGYMPIGKNTMRTYRLKGKLLGRYEMVAYIGRLGELLRVEFPDGLVLINDRLVD